MINHIKLLSQIHNNSEEIKQEIAKIYGLKVQPAPFEFIVEGEESLAKVLKELDEGDFSFKRVKISKDYEVFEFFENGEETFSIKIWL